MEELGLGPNPCSAEPGRTLLVLAQLAVLKHALQLVVNKGDTRENIDQGPEFRPPHIHDWERDL